MRARIPLQRMPPSTTTVDIGVRGMRIDESISSVRQTALRSPQARQPSARHPGLERNFVFEGLAPARGLEPRTLRLTDRCGPVQKRRLNTPRAVDCGQMPRFATALLYAKVLAVF